MVIIDQIRELPAQPYGLDWMIYEDRMLRRKLLKLLGYFY